MIKTETVTINTNSFVHTYSDAGKRIRQDGTDIIYDDAYDPADFGRTYTETDELISGDENVEVDDIDSLIEEVANE